MHITADCVHVDQITNIQQGDQLVFRQTFLDWQPKVYTYFTRRTRDNAFAEELTQLTFIKLWDFRHTLTPQYSFDTQLFRIARTTLIDGIRERERRRMLAHSLEANEQEAGNLFREAATASLEISNALNMLPPARKKVFLLNRIHGYSYKQIAGELSISDRTVEKHISLALKQLKKILTLLLFIAGC